MGFFHLSVGSYGFLPVKPLQKAHGIVVTLQLQKNISLYVSCILLYLSVDFQKPSILLEVNCPFQGERKERL